MVNLDAVPGKANRLIARRVPRVLTSARLVNRSGEYQRWTEVPPIVRPSVIARDGQVACRARIGLAPDRLTLLVTGGSQGAQSINRLVETLVARDPEAFRNWQVLHQCGKDEEDRLTQAFQQAGVRAIVRPFVSEMGDWWGAADLCVSRCGAGTVAEAWANGVPAIFLPYPFHRDEHQRHNAAVLVEKHAAILVTDRIDPAQTMPEFERAIMPLLNDRRALDAMKENVRSLGPASGAEQVTRALLDSSA